MNKSFVLAGFADEASPIIDNQIKALKRNGCEYLEIRGVDGTNISEISEIKAKEVKKKLDDNGLRVWSIGSPFGKIGIRDDFEPHFELYKKNLEISKIIGADKMRVFSFYVNKEKDPESVFFEVIRRLELMQNEAEKMGILLCHENEKGIYGDIAGRCERIHKALPKIRAVFDPANFVQCGQETLSAYEKLAPFVEYMHIKDSLEDGNIVRPGKGIGNIKELLEKTSVKVLTMEPHLRVFAGLDNLEMTGEKSAVGLETFKSGDEAFDAACDSIKKIIEEIKNEK